MITITITKWRVRARMVGDDIIEEGKVKLDSYKETKNDNVADRGELRNLFIEQISRDVVSKNRSEENKLKRKRSGEFIRLIISSIT